jgi:hypothetical protein
VLLISFSQSLEVRLPVLPSKGLTSSRSSAGTSWPWTCHSATRISSFGPKYGSLVSRLSRQYQRPALDANQHLTRVGEVGLKSLVLVLADIAPFG